MKTTNPTIKTLKTLTQRYYLMKSSLNWPPFTKKVRWFVEPKCKFVVTSN